VRSGADIQLVADCAIRTFAAQATEGGWKPAILEMSEAVGRALERLPTNPTETESARVFDYLEKHLDRIASDHPDSGVKILKQAAENAFTVLEEASIPFSWDRVQKEVLGQAARSLTDQRVLHPTRDEIARECNRDGTEQCCYEREVLGAVVRAASRLQGTVFSGSDPIRVRTPARQSPYRETTAERLLDTLAVLPGVGV
jgi:hypothetical protein